MYILNQGCSNDGPRIIRLFSLFTSALRLLALRGFRTVSVRRVALRAPGVTQYKLYFVFLYINIANKRIISHMDLKI